jgi:hypothetical protein
MSGENTNKVSHWKLMLVGNLSVMSRRVFVIVLTVVSLAVWTVTVIGMGVLRQSDGLGGTVQTAGASVVQTPAEGQATASEGQDSALTAAAASDGAGGLPAIAELARNPFKPDDVCFPKPAAKSGVGALQERSTQQEQEEDNTPGLQRDQLVPLKLTGTMTVGRDRVAIVHGNSVQVADRTLLLMLSEISSKYRVGEKMITVRDVSSQFKKGDTIEVRPVVIMADRIRITDEAIVLKVNEITNKSVVLTLGDKTYELEMTK